MPEVTHRYVRAWQCWGCARKVVDSADAREMGAEVVDSRLDLPEGVEVRYAEDMCEPCMAVVKEGRIPPDGPRLKQRTPASRIREAKEGR